MIRGSGLLDRIILTVVRVTLMFLAQPQDSCLLSDLRGRRCCGWFEEDIPTLSHTCAGYISIHLGTGGVDSGDKGDGDRSDRIAQHSR
jgi:hypothetical protein